MKFVGAHVSTAGGVDKAPRNAETIGARAFALFTRNQRQWTAKPLSADEIRDFRKNCRKIGYTSTQILAHDSYLINLGHPEREALAKSRTAFIAVPKGAIGPIPIARTHSRLIATARCCISEPTIRVKRHLPSSISLRARSPATSM